MPTTYAHDLFGKKIYHKLPKEMQMVIQRNVNLYRIGLHGPDILFYHMLKPKVSTTGIRMHKEKAAPFLRGEWRSCAKSTMRSSLPISLDSDAIIFWTAPAIPISRIWRRRK